jgi:hypothetical protein
MFSSPVQAALISSISESIFNTLKHINLSPELNADLQNRLTVRQSRKCSPTARIEVVYLFTERGLQDNGIRWARRSQPAADPRFFGPVVESETARLSRRYRSLAGAMKKRTKTP